MSSRAAAVFLLASLAASPAGAQAPGLPIFQGAEVIQTVRPAFPPSLAQAYPRGGTATVALTLDAQGKLTDALAVADTAPEFGAAALAAVGHWSFQPARWNGDPVPTCLTLVFNFALNQVVSISSGDLGPYIMRTHGEPPGSPRICTLRDLDHIPVPLRADAPYIPADLAKRGGSGEVVVGFYIDEKGRVRLPSLVAWPRNDLANLAMQAVRHWKFEPPVRNGAPVTVYVQQTFRFGLAALRSSPSQAQTIHRKFP